RVEASSAIWIAAAERGEPDPGRLARPFPYRQAWLPPKKKKGRKAEPPPAHTGPEYIHGTVMLALEGQKSGAFAGLRLVVNGRERGHVWADERAGGGGIRPVLRAGPYSFLAWYEGRIDALLAQVDGLYRENTAALPRS